MGKHGIVSIVHTALYRSRFFLFQVIAIGIGSGVHQDELKAIATDDQHAFTVANFNALGLSSIQSEIQNAACKCTLLKYQKRTSLNLQTA